MSLDSMLFLSINGTASSPHWLGSLALFSTEHLPQLMGGGIGGALVTGDRRVRLCVLRVITAMLLAWLLARVFQHLLPVQRPFADGLGLQWLPHANSHSFPSTHASVAFAFATAVAASTRRWHWALLALTLAAMVSWSRVYLGLHFPSDVVAGTLVGVISGWLTARIPFETSGLRTT